MHTTSRREFLGAAIGVAGASVLAARGAAASSHASLVVRRNIRSLSPAELDRLRAAFQVLQDTIGPNGYQHVAGHHGDPDWLCDHGSQFLPWHRAYLYELELALRSIDPTLSLPYWDWTSSWSISNGIPAAYSDATYTSGGTILRNPLFDAAVAGGGSTSRSPGMPSQLQNFADLVTAAYSEKTYAGFSNSINSPHGSFHGWVGNEMSSVMHAAYDPIFWAHHANVDRQWAKWQAGKNNSEPSAVEKQQTLNPFHRTVQSVLDHRALMNYEYEENDPMPPFTQFQSKMLEEGFPVGEIQLEQSQRLWLYVHELTESERSFTIDVFVNLPDANRETSLIDNEHYAGMFAIFGMGRASSHDHPAEPRNVRMVDLTDAVQHFADENGRLGELHVKFVARDNEGRPAGLDELPFKAISIKSY